VIPLSKIDFVHTRLTHSLEVSVVGRSLGRVGKKIIEISVFEGSAWLSYE
jgi:dGTPase